MTAKIQFRPMMVSIALSIISDGNAMETRFLENARQIMTIHPSVVLTSVIAHIMAMAIAVNIINAGKLTETLL